MATRSQTVTKKAAEFVTVACKIPQGLNVVIKDDAGEPIINVHLNGPHSAFAVAGHGMTQVRAEVWQQIVDYYKTHSGAKWLHNESVFVMADPESAADKADDRKSLDVGYNPIDPNKPGERARTGVAIQVEGAKDPGEGS